MTKEELSNLVSILTDSTSPNVELFILDEPLENEDNELDVNVYKGRMQEEMPHQITNLFFPKIHKTLVQLEYTLENYDPGIIPDRKVIWQYPSEGVPFYNLIIDKLSHNRNNYYDNELLPYHRIWSLWIKFRIKRNNYFLIKKITPSKVLTTGGVLAWVFRGENFRHLSDDILAIDNRFDVFIGEDTLFFENKQSFERLFMYETIIQQVANETFNEIQESGIVENIEQLKGMVGDDYYSIRKLNKLRQKQYFREKTFSDYYRIIQDYNVNIGVDVQNQKIQISDKNQAKLFIKVLNDDYLKSELTNLKYATNSKEDI